MLPTNAVTAISIRSLFGAVRTNRSRSDLVVQAPPLYIQEKVHPKALIDDLSRESRERAKEEEPDVPDLFADFNGLPNLEAKTEFYQHDQNWSNRMILGDSLQVMSSLAEREGLRGKVQCIYMDPPYGIKFNSNFQWSTTSRDVRDGKREHITREPEQVKAFRDTWRDGIHSYLTYLRDRLTVARDLLADSGSVFLQIGDENVHRVRAVMDEVFGEDNFVSMIQFQKTGSQAGNLIANTVDFILWFAKARERAKYRQLYNMRVAGHVSSDRYDHIDFGDGTERRLSKDEIGRRVDLPTGRIFQHTSLISSGQALGSEPEAFVFQGVGYHPSAGSHWKTTIKGLVTLAKAGRVSARKRTIRYRRAMDDFTVLPITDRWESLQIGTGLIYVVQTSSSVVARCLLMTTDPGDLVLDPTSGSGTTPFVAEQWGRRWITIDTSRVALALARARIMAARYPYYLLADSRDGQLKEAEIVRTAPSTSATRDDIRQGFVYERVPHITLKSIANNAEVHIIYERLQPTVEDTLADVNDSLLGHSVASRVEVGARQGTIIRFDDDTMDTTLPSGEVVPTNALLEWEVPREASEDWPEVAAEPLASFWEACIARQREMDASIAAHADLEFLYDKPYEDRTKVRVAGPFTVESLTPHRIVEAEPLSVGSPSGDQVEEARGEYNVGQYNRTTPTYDFTAVILEQLRTAGVQQADKRSKIEFTSLTGWPGKFICAEGRYREGAEERRSGIMIGPEHGTVGRADLIAAAREAGDAGFDVLISCAFNYDAQSTGTNKLGRIPILKARMNADLHMSADLKETKGGNLFVIFGEPDIDILPAPEDRIRVKINGVDLFDPRTGEVRSSEAADLACWFIDTNYDMESFFVRHAYFLGANDPYKALKTTLKAEIDEEAWQSLRSDTSRPFKKPDSGRIAVKAINHLGDEVMKVVDVS